MTAHRLKIHRHPAARPASRPPLLFVHGGYTHSLCWQHKLIPRFNELGYDCHALDLSGHGGSEGRDRLHRFGLADYAEDLARAVATIEVPPVLVGHSMGSLVVQRFVTAQPDAAAGIALLSPVPPTGTAGSAARLALTEPAFFEELPNATSGRPTERTLEVMARVYFSPGTPHRAIERFLPMIGPESDRAVSEMAVLPFLSARARPRLPALVMGGGEDKVFPASMLHFSAAAWHTRAVRIDGAGHMMMLDPQWQAAADALAAWLDGV
jgi:pimeloyl-ACP methyl ester carboxylesterase